MQKAREALVCLAVADAVWRRHRPVARLVPVVLVLPRVGHGVLLVKVLVLLRVEVRLLLMLLPVVLLLLLLLGPLSILPAGTCGIVMVPATPALIGSAVPRRRCRRRRPRPASVNPRDGHPLRRRVDLLERALQDPDRLVDVVVHDREVEVVAVVLLQGVRLARQLLQAAVVVLHRL